MHIRTYPGLYQFCDQLDEVDVLQQRLYSKLAMVPICIGLLGCVFLLSFSVAIMSVFVLLYAKQKKLRIFPILGLY